MNNDADGFRDSGLLGIAIQAMRSIDVADARGEVIRQAHSAICDAGIRRRRRIVVLRLAVAAIVILVLGGAAVFMTQTRRSYAFADVIGRVQATRTLRGVLVDPRNGGTLLVSGTRTRLEARDIVVISDAATGQQVMLDAKGKFAYRIPKRGIGPAVDFYGLVRSMSAAASIPAEEHIDEAGRHLFGFSGKAELNVGVGAPLSVDVKVWSDPATKLPVRLEVRSADASVKDPPVVIDQIKFDVALDDSLFDMTIPSGYRIPGLSRDQLKAPPSKEEAAKLTIVPGVGIGDAKFGMARAQVVAILGEPEFTMYDSLLCFPSKGLQLVFNAGNPSTFQSIIANPADAASRVRNDFPGQTDKGIRIGSSKQEVLDAYGEPDPLPPGYDKRIDMASYNIKLGIQFNFIEGKVDWIYAQKKR
ncbi:MAG TPA: hypothetical protein VH370_14080 [Humisphaera sp.]|jgi:hypothetical protein|nr:hypothetical protein [Humisphaera sp.]